MYLYANPAIQMWQQILRLSRPSNAFPSCVGVWSAHANCSLSFLFLVGKKCVLCCCFKVRHAGLVFSFKVAGVFFLPVFLSLEMVVR